MRVGGFVHSGWYARVLNSHTPPHHTPPRSIGCCLFELFTGRVTFPGANNNEMLRLMMELKGGLPQKLIRRHRAAYERLQLEPLFEADGRFRQLETDPVASEFESEVLGWRVFLCFGWMRVGR